MAAKRVRASFDEPSNPATAPLPRSSRHACSRSQTPPWETAAIGWTRGAHRYLRPGGGGPRARARDGRLQSGHTSRPVWVDLPQFREVIDRGSDVLEVPGQPPPSCPTLRYSMFHAAIPRRARSCASDVISVRSQPLRQNPPWRRTMHGHGPRPSRASGGSRPEPDGRRTPRWARGAAVDNGPDRQASSERFRVSASSSASTSSSFVEVECDPELVLAGRHDDPLGRERGHERGDVGRAHAHERAARARRAAHDRRPERVRARR